MNNKGFAPIFLIIAIVIVAGVVTSGFLLVNNSKRSSEIQTSDPPKGYEGEWIGADDTPLTLPQSVDTTQYSPMPTFGPGTGAWFKASIKVDNDPIDNSYTSQDYVIYKY